NPMNKLLSWALRGEPARPKRSEKQKRAGKRVNLALQGGGAHGAFTWGVIDCLLEDGRVGIDGLSGASAGAINAVMLARGLMRGGPDEARKRLADFWRAASIDGNLSSVQRQVFDGLFGVSSFATPMTNWMQTMSRFLTSEANPLAINPLKNLIEHFV